jgi:hypothetical protein
MIGRWMPFETFAVGRIPVRFSPTFEGLEPRIAASGLLGTDDPIPDPEPSPGPSPGPNAPIIDPTIPPTGPPGPGTS